MPNWVKNIVEFQGKKEDIDTLFEYVRNEAVFDFNEIIPMPEELNISEGHYLDIGMKCFICEDGYDMASVIDKYHLDEKTFEELYELGRKGVSNKLNYGYRSWYGWRTANWGTKWNACEPWAVNTNEEHKIAFETAWSAPVPIFDKLAELFPYVSFTVEYADEDTGYNCGSLTYQDGGLALKHYPPEGQEEAIAFAKNVWAKGNPPDPRNPKE